MLQSKENQNVPSVTFHTRQDNAWVDVTSNDIFAGKTVVVFALPGAFTPTCSSAHLPRYNQLAPTFKKHGVDEIVCLSVNDTFVMNSWAADQDAENITFIPDGNGDFSEGMGMLVDKSAIGFGKRSWRYSMLVRDGVIEKMFIEDDVPGDPFDVSDADTMLNYIAPKAVLPKLVSFISKPGCGHCERARVALTNAGMDYEEVKLGQKGMSLTTLKAISGNATTPQIFIDGELIGGADELDEWLEK
jgi:glutathione-dependent peroxiredoxin